MEQNNPSSEIDQAAEGGQKRVARRHALDESRPPAATDIRDREITLLEIWETVWSQRVLVILIGTIFAAGSVIVAMLLPTIYRSDAVLAQVSTERVSNISSQLGGLASLAGIRLGENSESNTALAVLRSRSFAGSFIEDQNLMPLFFADAWDAEAGTWLPEFADQPPVLFDAIRHFRQNVFFVEEDLTNGLVTVAIEWTDPETAAIWVNEIIGKINSETRQVALAESDRSLAYLKDQLDQASVVELQRSISSLIENEMQNQMMAQARDEFAFQIIDRGMVPTQRVRPRRTLIVLTSTFFGGLFGVFVAFLRNTVRRELELRKA